MAKLRGRLNAFTQAAIERPSALAGRRVRARLRSMNKPVRHPDQVTVTLSAEDAADLLVRVERGEFASLDEGVAAELAELNYRRAADIVGGSDKLEALLQELEQEAVDPAECVDGGQFLAEMLADLKARAAASDE